MTNIFKVIILTLLCFYLCAAKSFAESEVPAEAKKTQVVIIGTIHDKHYKNPRYSPDALKEIILSLKPDAILNELPLSLVDPNGRPLENLRKKDLQGGPECWAADTVATQLGIKQIPFDRPDRQENFKKIKYFEREKQSNKLANKWGQQIQKEDPNSIDLKILYLYGFASQSQGSFDSPESINSDGFDSIIKIKHLVWYEMMPQVLEKYNGYKEAASDLHFLKDQWQERNKIMANNIINVANNYPEKRLVVITGCEHRYILRDLLKQEKSIELKEYWQVTSPELLNGKRY